MLALWDWLVLAEGGDGAGTGFSEATDGLELLGRLGVLGRRNHVHRFGDLSDVVDGFDTDTEFLQFTRTVSNRLATRQGET